ncbi:MAG: hypothetical protein M0Z99_20420 [Betaproteobacteria bacterium]|nr:hypothetical protein [Betaproteobacteria bacterium]
MKFLIPMILLALTGCASIKQAGTASYTIKPMLIDGRTVCCEVAVTNGKQYASLDATLIKAGDDYTVTLSERGVEAFRGQEIAAGATKSLAGTAAKAAAAAVIAPLALPAAGAMLAAPRLGAAAAGAGAGVLINKAVNP